MATPNRIDVMTNTLINKRIADTVLPGNVFMARMILNAKPWKSGKTWDKTVKVSKNTNTGSFSGFDTLSFSALDNNIKLSFEPKFFRGSLGIAGTDLTINRMTGAKVEDLMEVQVQSTMEDMADDIADDFYGDGSGNGSKDFLGLAALVDDGNTVASIGGQSRSIYTTLQSSVTASGGTMTLAKLATSHTNAKRGNHVPTLHVTTEAVWNLYEQLLQPQERIVKEVSMMKGGLTMGTGATALVYRGKPVVADEKCTSGVWFMLNENFIDFIALPTAELGAKPLKFKAVFEGSPYSEVTGLGFTATDWIPSQGQYSAVKHIFLGGQLVTWNPNLHAKITGITTV